LTVAHDRRGELTVADLRRQDDLLKQLMSEVLQRGHHFGEVPGTKDEQTGKARLTLLKPGAEKLCQLFRLAPTFKVERLDMPDAHREIVCTCTLTHIGTGAVHAVGLGSCSTMESKYRWRNSSRACPECDAEAIRKSKNGPGFYCWKKIGGCGEQFEEGDRRIIDQKIGKVPNQDIADVYNTVLKMAAKRAAVAATLIATGAGDLFVLPENDAEDEGGDEPEPEAKPRKGGKRQEQPEQHEPPPPLTEKEQLIIDCSKACSALGGDAKLIGEVLAEAGLQPGLRFKDRNEEDLRKAKAALQAEVELRKGGTQK
jgi:hypothetical protein